MSLKQSFTSSEWQYIADGPEWVFAALAAADGNVAIMTKTKESSAFKKAMEDHRSRSKLVMEVISDSKKPSPEIKGATLSDAEQALETINAFLDNKAPSKEADLYRKFLIDISNTVASAAGEGLLGMGDKLSKKEQAALTKIKSALKTKRAEKQKPVAKKPVATKPKPSPAKRQVARPAAPRAVPPTKLGPKAPVYIAEHTVSEDETLSHIALKYYGSAVKEKWMIIYQANKETIGDNPNIIRPGQVLKIPKL